MSEKRNVSIDLIKAIAILGVIAIHAGSFVLSINPIGTFEWTSGLFWASFFRASVPLFLMASGAIMLDPEKEISFKKLYLHSISRILIAMFFWGFAYKIYHLIVESQITVENLWYSFKRLLLFDQEFHFYYIHIILIVYVLLPVTRLFVEKADKKLLQYSLTVWFVLAILFPTVKDFYPFNLLSGLTGQWLINMTWASVGYGILGYYLKKYPLKKKHCFLCLTLGFIIVFGFTFYMSKKYDYLYELFFQGMSVGVCLYAVGIFSYITLTGNKIKYKLSKIIVYISKASFCVYLSHMFVLYLFEKLSLTAQTLSIITVPLISVLVLLICTCIYAIISKIPILNKWII